MPNPKNLLNIRFHPELNPVLIFSIMMLFLCVGDAFMSYAIPVYLENRLQSAFLMGIILSSSSALGLLVDFYTNKYVPNANYHLLLKLTFFSTIAFPISMLILPPLPAFFLISMFIWGAYYEFRGLAAFNFVHRFVHPQQHTNAWAVISAFMSIAYFIGPTIAVLLIDDGEKKVFVAALSSFIIPIILYFIFRHKFSKKSKYYREPEHFKQRSVFREFSILKTLFKSVWPLALFGCTIWMVDSAFWTIGVLLTEQIKETSRLGSLILPLYLVPAIFVGLIVSKISVHFSKKRVAFISAILSGLCLMMMARFESIELILASVFLQSVFLSVSSLLNISVFEDYVSRLHEFGNDMASLEQASASVAYIIGPILWGWLGSAMGYQKTFAVTGILLASVATACLFTVPKKIKMPQHSLKDMG